MNAAQRNTWLWIKGLVAAHFEPLAIATVLFTLAGTLLAVIHQRDEANVARGIAVERARIADSTILAWVPLLHQADTKLVHDTIRVTKLVTRADTLRDSVLTHIHDTTYIVQYVAETDAALKACTDLKNDCVAFRESATKLLSAKDDKIHALESIKPHPSLFHDATRFAIGLGVGILVTHIK